MRRYALSENSRGHRRIKGMHEQAGNKSYLGLRACPARRDELSGMKPLFLSVICFFLIAIISASLAHAFYEWQEEESHLELRGLVRAFGAVFKNPEEQFFYEKEWEKGLGAFARLIMLAQAGENLGFEFNAYQTYLSSSLVSGLGTTGVAFDVERSGALEWNLINGKYVHLAIDRLSARWSRDRVDITLGRQPVNLATTYYFTPNDFFAPFAAQSFYRVYKPGVDAARAEVRLGDLSQLSLVSVLGYQSGDQDSDTGWSDSPEGYRTSAVARASTVAGDFEWAVIGGTVRESDIIGGSFQGELFGWLGLRAEGHRSESETAAGPRATEAVVGFEHKWESSLNIRLEQFYHGSGANSVSKYSPGTAYLARNYTALGVGYEFTPLWIGEFLTLFNWIDHSALLTANAVYSLSDERELSLIAGVPIGKKPDGPIIRSEFGLYPWSLNIEVRSYF
ncbi:MAG TPA: hypothetical protein DCO77_06485 [Nitrospiraceae bacterium]|nr:hypothetical protein [Nitrospiraceae bacterium]